MFKCIIKLNKVLISIIIIFNKYPYLNIYYYCNSNESKASVLSLDKSNNDLKKELLTIEEMKKNCCEKNNGSCEDNNLYDLDERANYLKIVKILNEQNFE